MRAWAKVFTEGPTLMLDLSVLARLQNCSSALLSASCSLVKGHDVGWADGSALLADSTKVIGKSASWELNKSSDETQKWEEDQNWKYDDQE